MVGEGEDELTEEESARLKAALRALQLPQEGVPDEATGVQAPVSPWEALCARLAIPEDGGPAMPAALPATLDAALEQLSAQQAQIVIEQLQKQLATCQGGEQHGCPKQATQG